ncbi:MAG: hypothetical protein AUI61_01790 [Thaumarchaeota archaeon 13_1_40CM_2_39_13_2]|nr:MAG: hypothetical protein AUI92_08345 [Thaumarchaeota archaeon 13_1_40CM_3_38_6]OLD33008.1 MAG: hypothetical protein AUI61_01790 [Thaumarchaeota archaeon 13_1_40CM_2_39_13_2]
MYCISGKTILARIIGVNMIKAVITAARRGVRLFPMTKDIAIDCSKASFDALYGEIGIACVFHLRKTTSRHNQCYS